MSMQKIYGIVWKSKSGKKIHTKFCYTYGVACKIKLDKDLKHPSVRHEIMDVHDFNHNK